MRQRADIFEAHVVAKLASFSHTDGSEPLLLLQVKKSLFVVAHSRPIILLDAQSSSEVGIDIFRSIIIYGAVVRIRYLMDNFISIAEEERKSKAAGI
jgi:hypothetical protein